MGSFNSIKTLPFNCFPSFGYAAKYRPDKRKLWASCDETGIGRRNPKMQLNGNRNTQQKTRSNLLKLGVEEDVEFSLA